MVTLYTQPGCGPCVGAESFLKQSGVEYRKVDITTDAGARQRLADGGFRGTPVIGAEGRLHTIDALRDVVARALKA